MPLQIYETLVHDVVANAIRAGATEAEVVLNHGDDFTVTVRREAVETLEQASPKAMGLRVITDHGLAFSTTSDFDEGALHRFITETVAMSRSVSRDEANALPQGMPVLPDRDLQLYDETLEKLTTDDKIALAMRAEAAAADFDPRITNSEGSVYSDHIGTVFLASSHGVYHSYRTSQACLYAVPLAEENGEKQSAWYVTAKRHFRELKSPETIGREAARRAIGKLGARKVPTQKAAVIYEYTAAGALWGAVFNALQGNNIYRKMSFLLDRVHQPVASPLVTLIDDGLLIRGLGSSLLDGEGVPQCRHVLIDKGNLRMYTYDTYYANKAGAKSTGHSQGRSTIGPHNCYLEPSPHTSLDDLIQATERGLLVTGFLGSNINIVTGDYSVGAVGHWIEKGQMAYPVHEVTLAGHLLDLMQKVDGIADDLEFWGSVGSPSFRISELSIAGQ